MKKGRTMTEERIIPQRSRKKASHENKGKTEEQQVKKNNRKN